MFCSFVEKSKQDLPTSTLRFTELTPESLGWGIPGDSFSLRLFPVFPHFFFFQKEFRNSKDASMDAEMSAIVLFGRRNRNS